MELIAGILIVLVVFYMFFGSSTEKTPPPTYACKGCGVVNNHNQRTLGAKNRGMKTFFCRDCHHKWIEKKKLEQEKQQTTNVSPQGSGCMVILFIPASLPFVNYFFF